MLLFVQFLFLFFFFSENVSSNIHHPRGISPHEESRIKSNRLRSHWIYGKTVRNFFPWSNLERTSGENLSCSLYTCRDIASIWRLFFSFIATAGTWETRANRKVAETPLFFLRLAGNQRIFRAPLVSTSSIRNVTDIRVSHYNRAIAVYFSSIFLTYNFFESLESIY